MRVLQIGKSQFGAGRGGGLDRVVAALGRHMPTAGVETQTLIFGGPDDAPPVGSVVVGDEAASLVDRWRTIREYVKAQGLLSSVDVVASHFALYTLPLLDLLNGHPVAVHFHGPWFAESQAEGDGRLHTAMKRGIEKIVYRRGNRYIVLSSAFRSVLVKEFGVDEDEIDIIPGGVDVRRYDVPYSREEARDRLGMPHGRPIILVVRRLRRRMGLKALLEAFKDVVRREPDAMLYIAGTGPLADELHSYVADHELGASVRFLGFISDEDLITAYRAATVSVVPTERLEGFGLICVESLAAGTPVLVTPVGGLPEVVQDLSPGLVFPSATAPEMAERLKAVFSGELRVPSSDACREFARRYDWSKIAMQVRDTYERMLR